MCTASTLGGSAIGAGSATGEASSRRAWLRSLQQLSSSPSRHAGATLVRVAAGRSSTVPDEGRDRAHDPLGHRQPVGLRSACLKHCVSSRPRRDQSTRHETNPPKPVPEDRRRSRLRRTEFLGPPGAQRARSNQREARARTSRACGPFGPCSTSYSTLAPSARLLYPSPRIAL